MPDIEKKLGPLLTGDRPLPASVNAEKAVLACMLLDPEQAIDVVLARLRVDECFQYPPHRRLYAAFKELRADLAPGRIDVIALHDLLARRGWVDDVGGEAYLAQLGGIVATSANLENYLDSVLDAYVLRRMIAVCSDAVGRCFESDGEVISLLDGVERDLRSVAEMRTDSRVRGIKELLNEAFGVIEGLHRQDKAVMGLPTQFADLDRMITGLKPGDLFVLAARPSIGKTTLALNIAANVALHGTPAPVGVFSLEMNAVQVVLRMICSEAKINLKDVRDGKLNNAQWKTDIIPAVDRLRKAPIYVDDTPQITAAELRQKARRMVADHHVQLIIIDYLQLMKATGMSKNANREQEVASLSSDIKALARDLKVPVMLLCQLNRQAEATGGRPKVSHLRESGAIEQDADMVALLHRERETDTGKTREEIEQGIEVELILAKHRNGETGTVNLLFFPQWTRFDSKSRVDQKDIEAISDV